MNNVEVRICEGDIFTFPGDLLLIISNIYGDCKGQNAMISQVLKHGGTNLVMQFRGFMNEIRGNRDLLGTTHIFPTHGKLKEMGFNCLILGYPITGNKDSLLEVFRHIRTHFRFEEKPTLSLTLPLIGTNVGGVTIEEWISMFKAFVDELKNSSDNNIHQINLSILPNKLSEHDYKKIKQLEIQHFE